MKIYGSEEQSLHQSWKADAACRAMDPDLFFPNRWDMDAMSEAKAVCLGCPVKAECLEYGLHENGGVWGGTSERERTRIRSARAKLARRLAASVGVNG